jgi:hypothetical protein
MAEEKKYLCPVCGEIGDYSARVNQQCNPYLIEILCTKCSKVINTPYELRHRYESGRGVTAYLKRIEL